MINIKTEDQALRLLKDISDGTKNYNFEELGIDKQLTTFKLKLFGEQYNDSKIPTKIMECLIDFQKKIYNAYSIVNYAGGDVRKLTAHDKQKLELYFEVTRGSVDIQACMDFAKTFLKDMESKHKVQIILILAITFFGHNFLSEYFSKEKEKSSNQIISDAIIALKEVNPNYNKIIEDSNRFKDKVISVSQDCDKIEFQGNTYSNNDIQNIIANKEAPEDNYVAKKIVSDYRIFKVENTSDIKINLIDDLNVRNRLNGVKVSSDIYENEKQLDILMKAFLNKKSLKLEILIQEDVENKNTKDPILLNIITEQGA